MYEKLKSKFDDTYNNEIDLIANYISTHFINTGMSKKLLRNVKTFPQASKLVLSIPIIATLEEPNNELGIAISNDSRDQFKLELLKDKEVLKNIIKFPKEAKLVISSVRYIRPCGFADQFIHNRLFLIKDKSVLKNIRKFPNESEFILYIFDIELDMLFQRDKLKNIFSVYYPDLNDQGLNHIKDNFKTLKLLSKSNMFLSDHRQYESHQDSTKPPAFIKISDLRKNPIDVFAEKNKEFGKLNKRRKKVIFSASLNVCRKSDFLHTLSGETRFTNLAITYETEKVLNNTKISLSSVKKLEAQLAFLEKNYGTIIEDSKRISERDDKINIPKSLVSILLKAVGRMLAI